MFYIHVFIFFYPPGAKVLWEFRLLGRKGSCRGVLLEPPGLTGQQHFSEKEFPGNRLH